MFRPCRAGSESRFCVYQLNPFHQCSIFQENTANNLTLFWRCQNISLLAKES